MLKVEQMTCQKSGGQLAANRIDLQVNKREQILIIGDSGSGKNKVASVLEKNERPLEGRIHAEGKIRSIGEGFPECKGVSVSDYLQIPLLFGDLSRKNAGKQIIYILNKCDLWKKREMQTIGLNVYQKCCLMFAMAVIQKPSIIVAEPCYRYLSKDDEMNFWEFILKWMREENITLISFSDHNMTGTFDKRYFLESGKLEVLG